MTLAHTIQRRYAEKMWQISQGAPVTFYAGEFLRYLLETKNQTPAWLDARMGYFEGYTQSYFAWHALSKPMIAKLSALTEKPSYFWGKRQFRPEEAVNIQFSEIDVTQLGNHQGGSHAARLARQQHAAAMASKEVPGATAYLH